MLGIDPVAAAMAEASRRARLPNLAFVVGAAEAIPAELLGRAERVVVNLPWGSLLRGALALDPRAAGGIAALLRPGGTAELLLAPAARDGLAADVDVATRAHDGLAPDWAALGLELVAARPATEGELQARPTTWGRRLGLGGPGRRGRPAADREPWLVVLRRP